MDISEGDEDIFMLTEACCPPVQLMRRLFRGLVCVRDALKRTRGGGRDVNFGLSGSTI